MPLHTGLYCDGIFNRIHAHPITAFLKAALFTMSPDFMSGQVTVTVFMLKAQNSRVSLEGWLSLTLRTTVRT